MAGEMQLPKAQPARPKTLGLESTAKPVGGGAATASSTTTAQEPATKVKYEIIMADPNSILPTLFLVTWIYFEFPYFRMMCKERM